MISHLAMTTGRLERTCTSKGRKKGLKKGFTLIAKKLLRKLTLSKSKS